MNKCTTDASFLKVICFQMAKDGKNLILMSYLGLLLLADHSHSETDTLQHGQELKGADGAQLVSVSQVFRLGFFNRNNKYYLGIWYNMHIDQNWYYSYYYYRNQQKPVWVANRNTPIPDKYGRLMIDNDGILKILRSGGQTMLLSLVQEHGNLSATLLDSGNFVLREMSSDGSVKRTLWQSFDHPTDALLPGMKLGIDLKTGHSWSLTSWDSDMSPASGTYSLEMDGDGKNQIIMKWAGEVLWTSGVWINGRFNLSHEFSSQSPYSFSFIRNKNEKYFTYHVEAKGKNFPVIVVDNHGFLTDLEQIYVLCSTKCFLRPAVECLSSNSSRRVGCAYKEYPACRNGLFDFTSKYGLASGDSVELNNTSCQVKCLENCSCVAYDDSDTRCRIWSRVKVRTSLQWDENSQTIYVQQSKENKGMKWVIVAVAGVLILMLFLLCYLIWGKHKNPVRWPWKSKPALLVWTKVERSLEQDILLHELGINAKHNSSESGKNSHELHFFSFESMEAATNNFSPENKLGEGGYGPVYKGKLADGQTIAIKRLSKNSHQGLIEFKNEVKVIAKLQHNNLVKLVGCCIEKEEKILIYEYMANKSLDFYLFNPKDQTEISWRERFKIIEGIAQGLLYLHKYSRLKIIHRDLKASNILLDNEMNPKISDFGMAKIFGSDESRAQTKRVVGTYGYMSPEYAIEGICSTKSDVFSFGILLLELLSGRRNSSFHDYEGPIGLRSYAWELWRQGRSSDLIDPKLGDACQSEMLRCIHVALLCVQENPMERPSMLDVTYMIYNEGNELPPPNPPAVYSRRNLRDAEIAELEHENQSLNEASITVMSAR